MIIDGSILRIYVTNCCFLLLLKVWVLFGEFDQGMGNGLALKMSVADCWIFWPRYEVCQILAKTSPVTSSFIKGGDIGNSGLIQKDLAKNCHHSNKYCWLSWVFLLFHEIVHFLFKQLIWKAPLTFFSPSLIREGDVQCVEIVSISLA